MSRFKNRYRATPDKGTVSIYIGGILKYQKYHYDKKMRENYCNKLFYDYINNDMEFVFKNEDIELVMKSHKAEDAQIKTKVVTELPVYKIDGEEYFDADKFCKLYELGYTIPSNNNLSPLKF